MIAFTSVLTCFGKKRQKTLNLILKYFLKKLIPQSKTFEVYWGSKCQPAIHVRAHHVQ